jgi:hypothetical protein
VPERFCEYCGEPFYQADTKKESRSVCTCGTAIRPGAIYCHICGGRVAGKGELATVPYAISGWNWGAFLLTWIWGLGNKTYIAFLVFVPFLGCVWPFVLGVKGNEWAWHNKTWQSVEQFEKTQKKWAIWGAITAVLSIVIICLLYIIESSVSGT